MSRRGQAFLLASVMFWQPLWAQADGIAVSGPGTNRDHVGNGVPIFSIAASNSAGLSHNQFHDYNVGSEGLILNSATVRTQSTQLGGIIRGNPNLGGQTANTIINEVNGGSPNRYRLVNAPEWPAVGRQSIFRRFPASSRGYHRRCTRSDGDPADGLAVTAVQGEGHAQFGAVLATEFKPVRAPTRIDGFYGNTSLVPTRHTGRFDPALKQKVVITHDPVNPLHVDRGQQLGFTGATQQSPDTTVAIAGQFANLLLDFDHQLSVVHRLASPYFGDTVCLIRTVNCERATPRHSLTRFTGRPSATRVSA
ncbi:hypothetical protein J2X66_005980 [Pseudomonas sp. 3296]|nr:hypothetical protein [Pseudomonas sp. 3296]